MTTYKMPKKFGIGIAQFVLGMVAIGYSNTAEALSCDEIIQMVGYDLPTDVIVNTVKGSGTRFSSEEIQCLVDKGAPQAVIEQAKRMSQRQESPVELPDEDE